MHYRINRLVVPELDDLVITPDHESVYVSSGQGIPEGDVVAEIDISIELVEKAKELLEAKLALQALLGDEEAIDDHFASQLTA
jgi:hypothetical protein